MDSMKEVLSYEKWISNITPDDVYKDSIGLLHVRYLNNEIYWTELRPAEQGRIALVCRDTQGNISDILPQNTNVRTRVHEYGGLAFTLNDSYVYYNYQNMTDLFLELSANNSEIMLLDSLETTYEGRDIWMVKLSDNVNKNEEEPGVLLMGAHHGNEKPSFEVLIYFIKHVVEYYYKENKDDDQDGLVNEDLIDGLDIDGSLLIPVGGIYQFQQLLRIKKLADGNISKEELGGVAFVPMRGKAGWK